jgi:glyoxylase-like metal-dependent hydrolase (beta-lactamase superfamily II)
MNTHGKLNIETFIEPSFQQNGFLLWCDAHPACWVVDPGFPPHTEQFLLTIRERELTPEAILLTHCHVDHMAGVTDVRAALADVPIVCPRGEEHMLVSPEDNLSAQLGLPVTAPAADRLVGHGDALSLGPLSWKVLDVSGHSPGGAGYYCEEAGVVLVGDAVFAESIGRYDFPHSSRKRLLTNIRENVLTLPAETMVYSGHGPPATIEQIKRFNQVLRWELEQC